MSFLKRSSTTCIRVGTENSSEIELHYNDRGRGAPIVLISGYPLDGNSWERQERELLERGYRCITYDRRGFGHSSQPALGYDYDTLAADLKALLDHLALDQQAVLVGFSMGTGEVTRYLGSYGSGGISKAVLIAPIQPYLVQGDDNPEGVPKEVFDGLKQGVVSDRYAFFDSFLGNLYNADESIPERLSDAALRASSQVAAGSGAYATLASIDSWLTDFRGDLPRIDVPVLAVHGTADRIVPLEKTTARLRDERLIDDLTVVEIAGGPHNIAWTHADEVNSALFSFLGSSAGDRDQAMATAGQM
jgi:non-heme chloroperoxidase